MIFLGDLKQIDSKNKHDSALTFLFNHFKDIPRIGIIEFTKDDIIRHPLVKVIENIFDSVEEKRIQTLKSSKPTPPKSQVIKEGGGLKSFFSKFFHHLNNFTLLLVI